MNTSRAATGRRSRPGRAGSSDERETRDEYDGRADHDEPGVEPVRTRGLPEALVSRPTRNPSPSHTEYAVEAGRMLAANSDAFSSRRRRAGRRTPRRAAAPRRLRRAR